MGHSNVAYSFEKKNHSDMKFSTSLKKNEDFRRVYKTGKSYANQFMVLYVAENHLPENRLGISVSKKVGNSVVRHHLCRLVRESYRLHESMFNSGLDMVVLCRVSASTATYADVEKSLMHLAKLHKILINKED